MKKRISVSLSTDDDGLLSQECPSCERRFKVKYNEGSDQPISFCPYCGHNDTGCWWTPEQAEYLSGRAAEEIVAPELGKMARNFNRKSRGGLFSMSTKVRRSPAPPPPKELDNDWPHVTFSCCGEVIKHDGQSSDLRCIICGKPLAASSHDGGEA